MDLSDIVSVDTPTQPKQPIAKPPSGGFSLADIVPVETAAPSVPAAPVAQPQPTLSGQTSATQVKSPMVPAVQSNVQSPKTKSASLFGSGPYETGYHSNPLAAGLKLAASPEPQEPSPLTKFLKKVTTKGDIEPGSGFLETIQQAYPNAQTGLPDLGAAALSVFFEPTKPATNPIEWFGRVWPESIGKLAPVIAKATFYDMPKPLIDMSKKYAKQMETIKTHIQDPALALELTEAADKEAREGTINWMWEQVLGLAEFQTSQVGGGGYIEQLRRYLHGQSPLSGEERRKLANEKFKERWASDPAGSVLAMIPVFGALVGAARSRAKVEAAKAEKAGAKREQRFNEATARAQELGAEKPIPGEPNPSAELTPPAPEIAGESPPAGKVPIRVKKKGKAAEAVVLQPEAAPAPLSLNDLVSPETPIAVESLPGVVPGNAANGLYWEHSNEGIGTYRFSNSNSGTYRRFKAEGGRQTNYIMGADGEWHPTERMIRTEGMIVDEVGDPVTPPWNGVETERNFVSETSAASENMGLSNQVSVDLTNLVRDLVKGTISLEDALKKRDEILGKQASPETPVVTEPVVAAPSPTLSGQKVTTQKKAAKGPYYSQLENGDFVRADGQPFKTEREAVARRAGTIPPFSKEFDYVPEEIAPGQWVMRNQRAGEVPVVAETKQKTPSFTEFVAEKGLDLQELDLGSKQYKDLVAEFRNKKEVVPEEMPEPSAEDLRVVEEPSGESPVPEKLSPLEAELWKAEDEALSDESLTSQGGPEGREIPAPEAPPSPDAPGMQFRQPKEATAELTERFRKMGERDRERMTLDEELIEKVTDVNRMLDGDSAVSRRDLQEWFGEMRGNLKAFKDEFESPEAFWEFENTFRAADRWVDEQVGGGGGVKLTSGIDPFDVVNQIRSLIRKGKGRLQEFTKEGAEDFTDQVMGGWREEFPHIFKYLDPQKVMENTTGSGDPYLVRMEKILEVYEKPMSTDGYRKQIELLAAKKEKVRNDMLDIMEQGRAVPDSLRKELTDSSDQLEALRTGWKLKQEGLDSGVGGVKLRSGIDLEDAKAALKGIVESYKKWKIAGGEGGLSMMAKELVEKGEWADPEKLMRVYESNQKDAAVAQKAKNWDEAGEISMHNFAFREAAEMLTNTGSWKDQGVVPGSKKGVILRSGIGPEDLLDSYRFFSNIARVAQDKLGKGRMPAAHFLKLLEKPENGVKAEEIQFTKTREWLSELGAKAVTAEDVARHLEENGTRIKETVLKTPPYKTAGERNEAVNNFREQLLEKYGDGIMDKMSPEEYAKLKELENGTTNDPSQYPSMVLPGGENYKETLVQLEGGDAQFTGGHWGEYPNTMGHIRSAEYRDVQGKRGEMLYEIQSDFASAYRKDEAPDAPFIKDKRKILELLFKRAVMAAVKDGKERVYWPSTAEQVAKIEQWTGVEQRGAGAKPQWTDVVNGNTGIQIGNTAFAISPSSGMHPFELRSMTEGHGQEFIDFFDTIAEAKRYVEESSAWKLGKIEQAAPGWYIKGSDKNVTSLIESYTVELPRIAKQLGKKYGVEPGKTEIVTSNASPHSNRQRAVPSVFERTSEPVNYLDLNPQIAEKGLSLYSNPIPELYKDVKQLIRKVLGKSVKVVEKKEFGSSDWFDFWEVRDAVRQHFIRDNNGEPFELNVGGMAGTITKEKAKEFLAGVDKLMKEAEAIALEIPEAAEKVKKITDIQQQRSELAEKVSRESLRKTLDRKVLDISYHLIDDLDSYGKAEAQRASRYFQATNGMPAQVAEITRGMDKAVFKKLNKRLGEVLERFVIHRRIKSVGDYDSTYKTATGVTPEMSKKYIENLEGVERLTKQEGEMIRRMADYLFEVPKDNLRAMRKRGLIGDTITIGKYTESLEDFLKHDYIPLLEEGEGKKLPRDLASAQKRVGVYDTGLVRLSHGKLDEILRFDVRGLVIESTASMYKRMVHNDAQLAMADLALVDKQNPFVRVGTKKKEAGIDAVPKGWIPTMYYKDGVKRKLYHNPEYFEEWIVKHQELSSQVAKFARVASGSSFIKKMAVGVNPAFALSNFMIDVQNIYFTAMYKSPSKGKWTHSYSPHPPVFLWQMAEDLKAVSRDARKMEGQFKDALADGLGFETLVTQSRGNRHGYGATSTLGRLENIFGAIGAYSERVTRLATRRRTIRDIAKEKGVPFEKALKEDLEIRRQGSFAAREYFDISRGGSFVKAADNFLPFVNAGTQAARSTWRAAKRNRQEFAARVGYLMAFSAGLYVTAQALFGDILDQVDEDTKRKNHIIPLGKWAYWTDDHGGKHYQALKIRKNPATLPFTATAEFAVDKMVGKAAKPEQIVASLKDSLSPVQDVMSLLPPSAQMAVTYMTNTDTWSLDTIWNGVPEAAAGTETSKRIPEFWNKVGEYSRMGGIFEGISPKRGYMAARELFPNNIFTQALGLADQYILADIPEPEREAMLFEIMSKYDPYRKLFYSTNPNTKLMGTFDEAAEQAATKVQQRTVAFRDKLEDALTAKDKKKYVKELFDFIRTETALDPEKRKQWLADWKIGQETWKSPHWSFWKRMIGSSKEVKAAVWSEMLDTYPQEEKSQLAQEAVRARLLTPEFMRALTIHRARKQEQD